MARTVLIVEDIETCADALALALSPMDVRLITVASGAEAMRVVDGDGPEVGAIITDLDMRGMDGFELIERVRSHARHGTLPIVVITGTPDPEAPARVKRLGANAFFGKPYSPAVVREKLEQLLRDHDSRI